MHILSSYMYIYIVLKFLFLPQKKICLIVFKIALCIIGWQPPIFAGHNCPTHRFRLSKKRTRLLGAAASRRTMSSLKHYISDSSSIAASVVSMKRFYQQPCYCAKVVLVKKQTYNLEKAGSTRYTEY